MQRALKFTHQISGFGSQAAAVHYTLVRHTSPLAEARRLILDRPCEFRSLRIRPVPCADAGRSCHGSRSATVLSYLNLHFGQIVGPSLPMPYAAEHARNSFDLMQHDSPVGCHQLLCRNSLAAHSLVKLDICVVTSRAGSQAKEAARIGSGPSLPSINIPYRYSPN